MHEFSLQFLSCVRCGQKLELDIIEEKNEIIEGFLYCQKCNLEFPIISKIPILWDNFSDYLSTRTKLGGKFIIQSSSKKMKSFVKKSLSKIRIQHEDRYSIEDRWTKIYQNSQKSQFYSEIKKHLKITNSELSLEHGCSIGSMTKILAKQSTIAFGIDRSFSAISIAKKNSEKNSDFFVSDLLEHPFGKQKFDLILALNVLELVEPLHFLKTISKQICKGQLILSDPYDFDRGANSVKKPVDDIHLRTELRNLQFTISTQTKKPSFIPWILHLNPRSTLHYKTDLVIAQKNQ